MFSRIQYTDHVQQVVLNIKNINLFILLNSEDLQFGVYHDKESSRISAVSKKKIHHHVSRKTTVVYTAFTF